MNFTAKTRLLTLLGDPVLHSRSPDIQNRAFEAAGVDGVYVALQCKEEDLAGLMLGLARCGGGGNITLPHKEKAAAIVEVASKAVLRTGACNTFWGDEEGRIHGDNTDVDGFRSALSSFIGEVSSGIRVLLLGGGGAARAALLGLIEEGADEVVIFNRTPERARAMSRRIGGQRTRVIRALDDLKGEGFDLVVNATSLGLEENDPASFDFELMSRVGVAMDLVYGSRVTPFVRAAEAMGIRATDGAEMLVQQGAASFERWWGMPAPVEAMRAAMEKSLAD
ncbi:MAG TPA: shikimate dehydrogenase [Gemmatimonadetes bacterium]|jgi:shikimate dehydrogenase|nr:shikimate dehydrogenase [Gemmatimonadota bacterium]HIN77206.1 shikimate dehydrogenase [Gemmatimonadota bacterium]